MAAGQTGLGAGEDRGHLFRPGLDPVADGVRASPGHATAVRLAAHRFLASVAWEYRQIAHLEWEPVTGQPGGTEKSLPIADASTSWASGRTRSSTTIRGRRCRSCPTGNRSGN